jgi:nitroreductase
MDSDAAEVTTTVDAVIRSRKTVRAFRAEQVPRSLLVEILELARTAPSTFNTQPWRVYVLAGMAKQTLSEAILQAHAANALPPHLALPNPAPPDCAARQADFGQRYYTTLGVDRMDMAAGSRQTGRNFVFSTHLLA